jgi:hypothetical protein
MFQQSQYHQVHSFFAADAAHFGVPHHEYLPVLSNLNSLPPLAM